MFRSDLNCDVNHLSCAIERLTDQISSSFWPDALATLLATLVGAGLSLFGAWLLWRRQNSVAIATAEADSRGRAIARYVSALTNFLTNSGTEGQLTSDIKDHALVLEALVLLNLETRDRGGRALDWVSRVTTEVLQFKRKVGESHKSHLERLSHRIGFIQSVLVQWHKGLLDPQTDFAEGVLEEKVAKMIKISDMAAKEGVNRIDLVGEVIKSKTLRKRWWSRRD
jgi:hypothetical protein